MNIVVLGLSITSSWGNGHATTYRGLIRELGANGHDVTFLERNVPWYAKNRDMLRPPGCRVRLYNGIGELKRLHAKTVRDADLVVVGSYVPHGVRVGEWVTRTAEGTTAFYDIDTPVTLAKLRCGDDEYLSRDLIPKFDLYLSFTGGPTLRRIEHEFGAPMARALYCSFDPDNYFPEEQKTKWDLGYLGTYSADRQPALDRLLVAPAKEWAQARFIVAGSQYPEKIRWPENVKRVNHVVPKQHRRFYNSQRFTLNVTRTEMVRAGWSPSVRLFEAAACGVPIISDSWNGLDQIFQVDREILVARNRDEVLAYLHDISETKRRAIGLRARRRVLREHTAAHRARQLESYVREVRAAARMEIAVRA